jgi:hypothetical protein
MNSWYTPYTSSGEDFIEESSFSNNASICSASSVSSLFDFGPIPHESFEAFVG